MAKVVPGVPEMFGPDDGIHITLQLKYDGTFDEETIAKANAWNDIVKNKVCHFDVADIEFMIGSVEHIDDVGGFLYVSSKLTEETKTMINGWIEEIFGETQSCFDPHVSLAVIRAKDGNNLAMMKDLNIPQQKRGTRHRPLKAINELRV